MAKRKKITKQTPAAQMFPDCSDMPLFSGTSVPAQDSRYAPKPAPAGRNVQMSMFDDTRSA